MVNVALRTNASQTKQNAMYNLTNLILLMVLFAVVFVSITHKVGLQDLEFGQLVGFAQDFVYETKQLGWYFISQCLEWLNDDKCDPCVCRDGNQNEVSTTKSAINLNKVAVSESASKGML